MNDESKAFTGNGAYQKNKDKGTHTSVRCDITAFRTIDDGGDTVTLCSEESDTLIVPTDTLKKAIGITL